MAQFDHALVVGGTGMLRAVTVRLALRYATVSVVARSSDRLRAVKEAAGQLSDRVNTISVDYRRPEFKTQLVDARDRFGRYSLAVGWIRSSAVGARDIVIEVMNVGPDVSRYFDVVGSVGRNPLIAAGERAIRYSQQRFVAYRTIVLGFVTEHGISRWLTDEELSNGVMHAVTTDLLSSTIGALDPWTARP